MGTAPQLRVREKKVWDKVRFLAAIDGERNGVKQFLEGSASGQMDANAARRVTDPGSDFEQASAQSFDLGGKGDSLN